MKISVHRITDVDAK